MWRKMVPRWPQDGPRWCQDGAKMALRWPKMGSRWRQDGPRWPQDGPGWAEMAQHGAQEGPKKAQEGLRGRPPQFFSAKKANLASSWRSKNVQNRGQNLKNSFLTDDNFWHRFLKGADVVFEWFLVQFLDGQMHQNCKNMNLAKSLKIVILPR